MYSIIASHNYMHSCVWSFPLVNYLYLITSSLVKECCLSMATIGFTHSRVTISQRVQQYACTNNHRGVPPYVWGGRGVCLCKKGMLSCAMLWGPTGYET